MVLVVGIVQPSFLHPATLLGLAADTAVLFVALAIGAVAGLASGIVCVRLKIPSFITTLAMGGVLYSAALVISRERSITLDESGRAYQSWITGQSFGWPNVVIVGLMVLAVAHLLQAHARFGRYSAAIGAGEPA